VLAAPPLQLRGVHLAFGPTRVLDGIDAEVPAGSRFGVVGPSGCGKSTLLALLAGLLQPDRGTVAVGGASEPRARLARCALMPQKDLLLPWRHALDNACLALENHGVRRARARAQARPLFERFGLAGFETTPPDQLSGGMRQRVAFIRTLLAGKPVLLLDEPFGALDSITRGQLQQWLADALREEARTVVLVTHDVEEALLLCDQVAVLSARPARVIHQLTVDVPRDGPRRRIVTDPAFLACREELLEALEK
jgi:NitT/TauT family transport system ATP-binding protein